MTRVNIRRAIESIRSITTVYSPVVEAVVNAIQAIATRGQKDGTVTIRVMRSAQLDLDSQQLGEVHSVEVVDDGIGFTAAHRESFDTLFSAMKLQEGGKGFGRFVCLKYFEDVFIDSVFEEKDTRTRRRFRMGKDDEIIADEQLTIAATAPIGTAVLLKDLRDGKVFDKKLSTIGRNLVDKLLPYFISRTYQCPTVTLSEADGSDRVVLNSYVSGDAADIIEVPSEPSSFVLRSAAGAEDFDVRIFRFYAPRNQKSKVSLVGHNREVTSVALHEYVPEFSDEFVDASVGEERPRNYIVRTYVFGPYLDGHVSLERGGFEFHAKNDLLHGISREQIEAQAASMTASAVGTEVTTRQETKREQVLAYVDLNAPWHKEYVDKLDMSKMPFNPTQEEIDARLNEVKFAHEQKVKRDVKQLLAHSSLAQVEDVVPEIVARITNTSKNELVHYIALRRSILDLFGRSLELDEHGKHASEGLVHDIIFPRRGDSVRTRFDGHNLWIVDERLNFTTYVSSDLPLNGGNSERPDLLAYDQRVVFRGDNEPSNPITIFEFKKPQRDDFVNPGSQEDPVQQIVRYVNNIRDGKFKTPEGRRMQVETNTPFYGYVVCDITPKVETWLHREKNFKVMPDRQGWFFWMENINLYVEVLSWDKLLKDASMRNKIFFEKLGI